MELSWSPGTTRRVPQEKFPRKPYNKSFIDQACWVKIAGYWPRSFLRVYRPRLRLAKKDTKKELGQCPAILTSHSHLVNNPYILCPDECPLKKLGCVCGPLPKTVILSMPEIGDFPYPIYDLTKHWNPMYDLNLILYENIVSDLPG